jgi:hypothetical protein
MNRPGSATIAFHPAQKTETLKPTSTFCAGWKAIVAEPGRFIRVENTEAGLNIPGVEHIFIYRKPGYKIGPLTDNSQMIGAVNARAGSRSKVEYIFDQCLNTIRIITSNPS